jgi:dihydroflavonol-4-reductase
MKALVTGANGLIGNNLVRTLIGEGVRVRAFVRPSSDTSLLRDLPVELVYGDVTEATGPLESASKGMDFIFHAAMYFTYAGKTREELETIALAGTANVIDAARSAGVRRVVVTSSSVVFGYSETPSVRDEKSGLANTARQTPYVAAKIQQDLHALALSREKNVDVVLVCPTITVGPYAKALGPSNGIIVAYLNDPWRFTYPGGCNIVSVTDVARGHWKAALNGIRGEHYILGSENMRWREIHKAIAELSGVKEPQFELNHLQSYMASTGDEVFSWLTGKVPLSTREQASMVGRYYWYADEKAAGLGYKPAPARTALAEAISWLAASPLISREVRTTLSLHPDVYRARRQLKQERA